jgi:hypothetical protein
MPNLCRRQERGAIAKDDRLDALAMAIAYWTEQLDRDTRKAEQDHREALLDASLRDFHASVFMYEQVPLNWSNR